LWNLGPGVTIAEALQPITQFAPVKIRTFQPGDEAIQAGLFNVAAFHLPGFKPATADDVRKRTRGRGFDPDTRFYAEDAGQLVGYCVLEPEQGRISVPWCRKGCEAAAPELFAEALDAARERKLPKVFAAYRRDWEPALKFLAANGFAHARDVVNYWADPVDLPTLVNRSKLPINRLTREDLPALAAMGKGIVRLPAAKLEGYFFSNPHFVAEAFLVLRGGDGKTPVAIGVGIESATHADVRKVDPLAPCYRLAAFGTEGLNTKRVNGLFSYLVADPAQALTAGLALLSEASQEMTEGTVHAMAAQCPSDAPHLVAFYNRYFKEQGRFPEWERTL
jgi:hypothetical protein